MKECCCTCRHMYIGHKTDFTKLKTGEPIDSVMKGYICMAFAYENVATWMVGNNPSMGLCEAYTPRRGGDDENNTI